MVQLLHIMYVGPLAKKALQVFREDRMAYTLWGCDIQLNDVQKEAIKKAITNCFYLIQGPPGETNFLDIEHLINIQIAFI